MRNSIKTLLLATAMVAGGAGLAMAQSVPIDAVDEAPDSVYNPNSRLVYGQPVQANSRSGRGSYGYYDGYRGRAMTGQYGSPYAASSPGFFEQQGRDQSDLGEF
jgi:hypothetical protein